MQLQQAAEQRVRLRTQRRRRACSRGMPRIATCDGRPGSAPTVVSQSSTDRPFPVLSQSSTDRPFPAWSFTPCCSGLALQAFLAHPCNQARTMFPPSSQVTAGIPTPDRTPIAPAHRRWCGSPPRSRRRRARVPAFQAAARPPRRPKPPAARSRRQSPPRRCRACGLGAGEREGTALKRSNAGVQMAHTSDGPTSPALPA
jgi:hypothetical protein